MSRDVPEFGAHPEQLALQVGALRQRPGDQQLPTINEGEPFIQDLVIADIEARRQLGIQRYGTALQAHNGRDSLRDAYEEAIDLTLYLKQRLVEEGD